MLINRLYFFGELSVPNSEDPAVGSRLDAFISRFERKFLDDVLGTSLYGLFRTGLTVTPADAKWSTLLSGNGDYWRGLTYVDDLDNLKSPIANFIYFHWMRDKASQTTALGEKLPTIEGGKRTSPINKQVVVWNEMCEQVDALFWFLKTNATLYPTYLEIEVAKLLNYQPINAYF